MNRIDRQTLEQLQAQIHAAQTALAELGPELRFQRRQVEETAAAMQESKAALTAAWGNLAVLHSAPSRWRDPDLQASFAQLLLPVIGSASLLVALWCSI